MTNDRQINKQQSREEGSVGKWARIATTTMAPPSPPRSTIKESGRVRSSSLSSSSSLMSSFFLKKKKTPPPPAAVTGGTTMTNDHQQDHQHHHQQQQHRGEENEQVDDVGTEVSLLCRTVRPTDIPICYELERQSYPPDEAATLSQFQYRQHHAASFFRCAVIVGDTSSITGSHANDDSNKNNDKKEGVDDLEEANGNLPVDETCLARDSTNKSNHSTGGRTVVVRQSIQETLVGYICSTRCRQLTKESMSTHTPGGPIVVIHSIVIHPQYRHYGLGSQMLQEYIETVIEMEMEVNSGLEKIMLLTKPHLFTFYLHAGFSILGPSPIQHGKEIWYEAEYILPDSARRINPTPKKSTASTIANMTPTSSSSSPALRSSSSFASGHHPIMKTPCFVVDAFVTTPPTATKASSSSSSSTTTTTTIASCGSQGNPAAVVLLNEYHQNELHQYFVEQNNIQQQQEEATKEIEWLSPTMRQWMHMVATEFNLSETAYLWPCMEMNDNDMDTNNNTNHDEENKSRNELHYYIRYFTPMVEVDLCGHATFASAAVLFQMLSGSSILLSTSSSYHQNYTNTTTTTASTTSSISSSTGLIHPDIIRVYNPLATTIVFHLRNNVCLQANLVSTMVSHSITATKIRMEFPVNETIEIMNHDSKIAICKMIQKAFHHEEEPSSGSIHEESTSTNSISWLQSGSPHIIYIGLVPVLGDVLVEVSYEAWTRLHASPMNGIVNSQAFLDSIDGYSRGFILTCRVPGVVDHHHPENENKQNHDVDFYSRFFAPHVGIMEDSVTGSAHTALTPYYATQLHKDTLVAIQKSNRGGRIECQMIRGQRQGPDDQKNDRVQLAGWSVTNLTGQLLV